jgi:hypothetical protein
MQAIRNRSITILDEAVGEPREGREGREAEQDRLVASVSYCKGRGYTLRARVEVAEESGGTGWRRFALMTGIGYTEHVLSASRYSAKKLTTLSATIKADTSLVEKLAPLKVELARRLAAGESY